MRVISWLASQDGLCSMQSDIIPKTNSSNYPEEHNKMLFCVQEDSNLFSVVSRCLNKCCVEQWLPHCGPRNEGYIYIYRHTHRHTYINTCTYIHMHACIHTYMHAYIHTYIHAYIHTYIHTNAHIYVHTYIHTYVRTHTHIRMCVSTYSHVQSAQLCSCSFPIFQPHVCTAIACLQAVHYVVYQSVRSDSSSL